LGHGNLQGSGGGTITVVVVVVDDDVALVASCLLNFHSSTAYCLLYNMPTNNKSILLVATASKRIRTTDSLIC
jgi:hypothetical protein